MNTKWLSLIVVAVVIGLLVMPLSPRSVEVAGARVVQADQCRCCVSDVYGTIRSHGFVSEGDANCPGEESEQQPDPQLDLSFGLKLFSFEPLTVEQVETTDTFVTDSPMTAFLAPRGGGEAGRVYWPEGSSSCNKKTLSMPGIDTVDHGIFHSWIANPPYCGSHVSCGGEEGLLEMVLAAADRHDYSALADLHTDNQRKILVNAPRGMVQFVDCTGRISAQLSIDAARMRDAIVRGQKERSTPILRAWQRK